jgi:aspartate aminotransferase
MPQLARRIGRAKPSAIMVVAEKAKKLKAEGRDIISFSIGVPNFLPGDHVYQAAREALAKDSGQYGSNRGSDALLDAFLQAHRSHRPDRLHAGQRRHRHRRQARHLQPGRSAAGRRRHHRLPDAVLDQLRRHRGHRQREDRTAAVPGQQDYKLTPAQLDAALAKKPKVFLFNNPSNPTGMVYTKDEIAALADVLVKYPDTWIITDDIYNRMCSTDWATTTSCRPPRNCATA